MGILPNAGGLRRTALALLVAMVVMLAAASACAEASICKVGAYVTGLSSINFGDQEVHVDLYTWMRCPLAVPAANMALAVVGANEEDRSETYEENLETERYRYERIRATVRMPLSLRRYPFDTQRIEFDLESSVATASEVRYVIDDDPVLRQRPCCLDEHVEIPDWRIASSTITADVRRFRTRFGYIRPGQETSEFPRIRLQIRVHREVQPYLWKVLLPLLIILGMAFQSLFWPPGEFEAASNVLIASLLSVVASHLTQRSDLPNTGYLVHGDLFFVHAYLVLLAMLVAASRVYQAHERDDLDAAHRLQARLRMAIPLLLVLGWISIIVTG